MSQISFTGDVMKSSRYLKRFKRLAGGLELMGDTILVEKLGRVETLTKGGIYIPTSTPGGTYKSLAADEVIEFGVVLMTGPGDVDGDGQHCLMTTKVGDIISLPMNVQWYSQFGHLKDYEMGTIGRMRDAQVMMVFPDYNKAMEALNGEEESEVQSVLPESDIGHGSNDL